MEKRKLLLVAISVGIFLVIAIGAAILFFGPKNPAASSGAVTSNPNKVQPSPEVHGGVSSSSSPSTLPYPSAGQDSYGNTVDAVDLVRKPGEVPGLKTPPEGSIQPGAEYYVNGTAYSGGNAETVISVPRPSTAAVPDTPKATPLPARVVAPAAEAAPPAPKAAAKPAATAKAPVQTKVYDDFWVQTGAFSTSDSAEGVKETLASKGIMSIIENRDVEGKTMFRVRVGPYTSKNEADYWLSLIQTIGGFENSQIRQTQSRR